MASLIELQRAFHDAITGITALDTACSIVREDGLDRSRRLRAYAHAYWSRLAGVLVGDFPKLQAMVGPGAFDELAAAYVRAHRPCAPSLRELGVHFASFLAARGDALHADLARLERARVEVFDGPDATPLSRDELAALAPETFPALRLQLVPSSMLLELSTNADDVWDAIEQGARVPDPQRGERSVLVWRRDLTIIHRTLDADELPAIRRMVRGTSFGKLCDGLSIERALELLLRWLDAGIARRDALDSAP